MSTIAKAFRNGKAFIGFVTGGDPSIEATEEFVEEMAGAGADLVEIGIPFSDPIAEGPVIQEANIRALAGGATVEKLFAMVERLRKRTSVPLVFLTYLNPVFHYGYGPFLGRCAEAGLDGLIIPDLPFEEQGELKGAASERGVDIISLAAPTSEDRVRKIAAGARGFLYVVSSMGVTGAREEIRTDLAALIAQARSVSEVPVAVGFGIHTPAQAADIAKVADGVIVGSAIVKIAAQYGRAAGPRIARYVREMKAAASGAA